MISALADAGSVLGERALPRGRDGLRGLPAARAARSSGAPAADLLRRRGPPRRLPRGPRLPARGSADALRSELRGALVRRGAPSRGGPRRALRRPRARGLLLDRLRPRAVDRQAQGPRGRADPGRGLERGPRPAAAGGPQRRGRPTSARPSRCCVLAHELAARYPLVVRPPAAGDRLPRLGRRARWPWSDRPRAPAGALEAVVRARPRPRLVLAAGPGDGEQPSAVPLLEGRSAARGSRGRLRLRALRLPAAGQRARRARGPARRARERPLRRTPLRGSRGSGPAPSWSPGRGSPPTPGA